jgi:hypothetical protein
MIITAKHGELPVVPGESREETKRRPGSEAYAAERPRPLSDGPGTPAVAMEAERQGMCHVEFRDGRAYWIAGPVRFPVEGER